MTNENQMLIRAIIACQLSIPLDKVTDNELLVDNLGADSLDQIEIIIELENKFDIEIPDEDFEKIKTVKDCFTLLETLGVQ